MDKDVKRTLLQLFVLSLCGIFCFLYCFVFGPFVYIKYKSCLEPREITIPNNIRVFERSFNNADDAIAFSRYNYDAPHLCVDTIRSKMCAGESFKAEMVPLKAKKIVFTGTVVKSYSLNAFVSGYMTLEVIIEGKKYWASSYDYFELLPLEEKKKINFFNDEPICMFYKIRSFKITR